MNIHRGGTSVACGACCHDTAGRPRPRPPASRWLLEGAGWIIPAGALALIPKCPMCVAAYVALGTGLALSASSASYLRLTLLAACGAWLSVMALILLRRVFSRRPRVTGRRESITQPH